MSSYRVLIVDDQHEIRRMLSAGIATLDEDIEVMDVPSGEEAMLVTSRRPVDLLVTDVRLPGMSGLELLGRLKRRNPELKVILLTGVSDPKVRKQVADAGAEAFFYKPVDLADILDAVERSLGLVETIFPAAPLAQVSPENNEVQALTLPEQLSFLRQNLNVTAVALLDADGRVVAATSEWPGAKLEGGLITSMLATTSASAKLSLLLNAAVPESLIYLKGASYSLCLAHIGERFTLLVADEKMLDIGQLSACAPTIAAAVQDLGRTLLSPVVPPFSEPIDEVSPFVEDEEEAETLSDLPAEELPALEALFQTVDQGQGVAVDLDSFWEHAAESMEELASADTLSFEQAQKLGLAPGEERS